MQLWHKDCFSIGSNRKKGGNQLFKRKLYCTNCSKEFEDDEGIYAKMKAPKHSIMVEIKAYLKKKSEIYCTDCFEQIK